jgi:hypothetical protein
MRVSILVAAAVLSSSAVADSCVRLQGSMVVNKCQTCMEVTVRGLRPRAEQAVAMFASEPRSVRVEAGGQVAVPDGDRLAITDLRACQ